MAKGNLSACLFLLQEMIGGRRHVMRFGHGRTRMINIFAAFAAAGRWRWCIGFSPYIFSRKAKPMPCLAPSDTGLRCWRPCGFWFATLIASRHRFMGLMQKNLRQAGLFQGASDPRKRPARLLT